MQLLVICGAVIVVFLVWRLLSSSSSKQPGQRTSKPQQASARSPYLSMSLMLPIKHCASAAEVENKRFLVREAPTLPLDGCDHTTCKCGFIKHPDRREDDSDRRALYGLRAELHAINAGNERRKRRGRRASDFAMA
jgi:hypothetical protein